MVQHWRHMSHHLYPCHCRHWCLVHHLARKFLWYSWIGSAFVSAKWPCITTTLMVLGVPHSEAVTFVLSVSNEHHCSTCVNSPWVLSDCHDSTLHNHRFLVHLGFTPNMCTPHVASLLLKSIMTNPSCWVAQAIASSATFWAYHQVPLCCPSLHASHWSDTGTPIWPGSSDEVYPMT